MHQARPAAPPQQRRPRSERGRQRRRLDRAAAASVGIGFSGTCAAGLSLAAFLHSPTLPTATQPPGPTYATEAVGPALYRGIALPGIEFAPVGAGYTGADPGEPQLELVDLASSEDEEAVAERGEGI